jgi:hypothetical protein
MQSASALAGNVTGLFACLACIAFMVLLVQGGFTQNAGIAMGVCCLCSCLNGTINTMSAPKESKQKTSTK